jgi:hypothetical protein
MRNRATPQLSIIPTPACGCKDDDSMAKLTTLPCSHEECPDPTRSILFGSSGTLHLGYSGAQCLTTWDAYAGRGMARECRHSTAPTEIKHHESHSGGSITLRGAADVPALAVMNDATPAVA